MAAELAGLAVGGHHHGHGVPADDRADLPFQRVVTGALGLHVRRDGVDVLGGRGERQVGAGAAGDLDHALQQLVGTLRAVVLDDGADRVDPLLGLGGIGIVLEQGCKRAFVRRGHAPRGPVAAPRKVWGQVRPILPAGRPGPDCRVRPLRAGPAGPRGWVFRAGHPRRLARIWASMAAMAVTLTTRREVASGVRMCAGLSRPIRIGPMATPSVATRNML